MSDKQIVSNYRTIVFDGRVIRIEGSAHSGYIQPTVATNPNCKNCKDRYTEQCNFCYIPKKSTIPSCYKKVKATFIRVNDRMIRTNGQWGQRNISARGTIQPMTDFDPICKKCANYRTVSCNKCEWLGDVSPTATHSHFKEKQSTGTVPVKTISLNGDTTTTSIETIQSEPKGITIEEIEMEVPPAYEVSENFSFFKMLKDGKTIFMGLAHKDNIEMLKRLFEDKQDATQEDDKIYHIPKDKLKILVTDDLRFVHLDDLDDEGKNALVDELFSLIANALKTKDVDGSEIDENGEFPEGKCTMCGGDLRDPNEELCENCIAWYEDWYPNGFP